MERPHQNSPCIPPTQAAVGSDASLARVQLRRLLHGQTNPENVYRAPQARSSLQDKAAYQPGPIEGVALPLDQVLFQRGHGGDAGQHQNESKGSVAVVHV